MSWMCSRVKAFHGGIAANLNLTNVGNAAIAYKVAFFATEYDVFICTTGTGSTYRKVRKGVDDRKLDVMVRFQSHHFLP